MDFIQQLKAFDEISFGNITPNALAIYFRLFMVNNKTGWKEWFTESDYWLGRAVGISRRETIISALNVLKQKGLIDFERGKKGQQSKYKIVPLFNSGMDSGTNSGTNSGSHSGITSGMNSDSPKQETKDNKTSKQVNNKGARAKFVPPTLEEVNQYVMENGLHVSAKDFVDYFTDTGWVDAKGQKVVSWKGKLRTWEKYQAKDKLSTGLSTGNPQVDMCKRVIDFFESQEGSESD